jgi:putative aldouronate transport system permease protein
MSKPVLATISLFTAVGHWNDWYSGSFFVRDPLLKPLATLLQEMLTRQAALSDILLRSSGAQAYAMLDKVTVTGESLQMATIIVVMLPMIIAYPFIQKYFVKGITVGSIKE